jgi:hypothetical protein
MCAPAGSVITPNLVVGRGDRRDPRPSAAVMKNNNTHPTPSTRRPSGAALDLMIYAAAVVLSAGLLLPAVVLAGAGAAR